MWYFSKEFKCLPFLPVLMTSTVCVIVPYVCPVFNIWFDYLELPQLLLMAWICSLYLTLNVLPVWATYFNGKSRNFIWYMSLLLCLSVCEWCLHILLIVFCVRNATLELRAFKNHFRSFILWSAILQTSCSLVGSCGFLSHVFNMNAFLQSRDSVSYVLLHDARVTFLALQTCSTPKNISCLWPTNQPQAALRSLATNILQGRLSSRS
jgi:hypothetical protein